MQDAVNRVSQNEDYAELRRRVAALGFFERQPFYYAVKLLLTGGLIVIALTGLVLADSAVEYALAGGFLGIVGGQVGFVLHDSAHRQIFPPGRRADALMLLTGPVLLGLSGFWWKHKHNLHHAHPNDVDHDPDVRISVLAFTKDQALEKPWYVRPLTRYQAFLLFPFLLLEGLQLRLASVKFLATTRSRYRSTEALLLTGHVGGYLALLVAGVGVGAAAIVFAVHQAVFGLYMGSVFAPNHKGMPVGDELDDPSFLEEQVLTARNVRGSPAVDWWYGGLNYQIEHHLFPTLPRNRLRAAQPIVRAFCAERGIAYYETSLPRSYCELIASLHEASSPLRTRVRRSSLRA